MVETAQQRLENESQMIVAAMPSAINAAAEFYKTPDAVFSEVDRIVAKIEMTINGEQNSTAAIALHAVLVGVIKSSLAQEEAN